jgi:hypothetical protein
MERLGLCAQAGVTIESGGRLYLSKSGRALFATAFLPTGWQHAPCCFALLPRIISFYHAQNEQIEKSIIKEICFVIEVIESHCYVVCLFC